MRPDRLYQMLSIAIKGGFLVSGSYPVEAAVKKGEACLVIISEDASKNTFKKFTNSCSFYEVPYIIYGQSEEMGHSIGKGFRKVLAVTDEGIAAKIIEINKKIGGSNRDGEKEDS